MRSIHIQRHIPQLQLPNRIRDPLPIRPTRIPTQPHVLIRNRIPKAIRLQHNRKAHIRRPDQRRRIRIHKRVLMLAQPVVSERKLPRRGTRAAVALGQVIQHEADDERRRGRRWTARASAMVLVRVLRPAMLVIG